MPIPQALLGLIKGIDNNGDSNKEKWGQPRKRVLFCKECNEDATEHVMEDIASGTLVCTACGLVLQDNIIDYRPEWRHFSNDDNDSVDPTRVGNAASYLLKGSQLETAIGERPSGARGPHNLSGAHNKATISIVNKELSAVYADIDTYCSNLRLGKIVADSAKVLYLGVHDAKLVRQRQKDRAAVISAAIILACRKHNYTKLYKDVVRITRVSKKDCYAVLKVLDQHMATKKALQMPTEQMHVATATTLAGAMCERMCNDLGLVPSFQMGKLAQEFAENYDKLQHSYNPVPSSVAAACCYMAAHLTGQPRSLSSLQKSAGVSQSTLKRVYRIMHASRDQIIKMESEAVIRIQEFIEKQASNVAKGSEGASIALNLSLSNLPSH